MIIFRKNILWPNLEKGEIDITRKEKIYNICCRIMCFIPFIFTIISEKLGIPGTIKNFIWLIMFMVLLFWY